LLNITASANGILQDTTLIRQKILTALQQKDTLTLRSSAEKYAFYGNNVQKAWVYTQLAKFYLAQNKTEFAIKYAKKALSYTQKQNKAFLFYICQSAYFLQSNYNLSDLNKDSVYTHTTDSILVRKSLFVYLLSQIHQYEWKEAQKLTKLYFSDTTTYWDSVFTVHTNKIKLKSAKKAVVLSYILPGLGQVYSGHIIQGFFSLTIVSLLGFFLFYTIKNRWYLIGYFMVFGIFRRFYMGGAKFAEKQVYYHNTKQNENCVKLLKNEIKQFNEKNK
jgi:TM2 domain-containing membrane protein YozV